jgi:hypothetical protein
MSKKIWHIGNTTVRNPLRIREGLSAILSSNLEGDLRGEASEKKLIEALKSRELVNLGNDVTYSIGRKWRSAMGQLGFLVPKTNKALKEKLKDLGPVDYISKNGHLLLSAQTIPAVQEAFLRSLLVYKIPNHSEKYDFKPFSPLILVLDIIYELEQAGEEAKISFVEMETIVQLSNYDNNGLNSTVRKIIDYRKRRKESESKRVFDNIERKKVKEEAGVTISTLSDYADVNFRYLKITGLFATSGRAIIFYKEKKSLIDKIISLSREELSEEEYVTNICNGSKLPTDSFDDAEIEFRRLLGQAREKGLQTEDMLEPISVQNINTNRYSLEERLFLNAEEEYAKNQKNEWDEISKYMEVLVEGKNIELYEEGGIYIPKTERPAYFEWVLWRAFLAVNHLVNKPYEARRFKVDQSFLPLSTAPGNGPDSIFEFDNFVIGLEVTLTEGSRQESAESESVKRHIAKMTEKYNKDVYGLFIARKIDSNAAHTFLTGVWFNKEDKETALNVIPIPLLGFKEFFVSLFENNKNHPREVLSLLNDCIAIKEGKNGPTWKDEVELIVAEKTISNASSGL